MTSTTITTTINGTIVLDNNDNLTITSTGSIIGPSTTYAVVDSGNIGTLTNDGVIRGLGGIDSLGTITSLTNNGVIDGTRLYGINAGAIGTLTNSGDIHGPVDAIVVTGNIECIDNESGGVISGGTSHFLANSGAILDFGTIGTLTNEGSIIGVAGNAISAPGTYNPLTFETTYGAINSLSNFGTISAESTAIETNGTIGMLTNAGSIVAQNQVAISAADIGTVTNTGIIKSADSSAISDSGTLTGLDNAAHATISGASDGIGIAGTIGTLTNEGSITGAKRAGLGAGNGINYLSNAGTITGGQTGVDDVGTIGTLTNDGMITGGQIGLQAYNVVETITNGHFGSHPGLAIGTLTNEGVVAGGQIGLDATGIVAGITNDGTITGGKTGISQFYGTLATLTNNGTISGLDVGITASNIGTIENAGTITGSYAIETSGPGGTLILDPTSVIEGTVLMPDGTLLLGGSAANTVTGIGTQYNGFTTISFENANATAEGNAAGLADGQTITGLVIGDSITLDGFAAVSETYVAGTGLILTNADSTTETLDITGTYTTQNFQVSNNGTDTTITDIPSTTVIGSTVTTEVELGAAENLAVTSTGGINATPTAVFAANSVGAISNDGTITGGMQTNDNAIEIEGSLGTLTNGGLIEGWNGINVSGTITSISNHGSIKAVAYAVYAGGDPTNLDNAANALIESSGTAIDVAGAIGTLTNEGTITAIYGKGVLANGDINDLDNAGIINGEENGVSSYGSIGTLTNEGTIAGSFIAINANGIGTLTNSGLISGGITDYGNLASLDNAANASIVSGTGMFSGAAIFVTGNVTSLTNATNASIKGNSNAIIVYDSIGKLTNEGTITTGFNSAISAGGSIDALQNNGSISGGSSAITASGIGTLTNDGTITAGSMQGQYVIEINGNLADLDNQAHGNISSNSGTELRVNGSVGTLTNEGTISSGFNSAIFVTDNIDSLQNTGLISSDAGGSATAIYSSSIGTLTNSGTIEATSGNAIYASSIGTITNSGTITGVIVDQGALTDLENSASGTINGSIYANTISTVSNYGSITGGLYVATTIGTLTNDGFIGEISAENITSIDNEANGNITGGTSAGLYARGTIGTLTNAGTITATGVCGINAVHGIAYLHNSGIITAKTGIESGGNIGTLINDGTISGSYDGIFSSSAGTIENAGIISARNYAIDVAAAGSTLVLDPTSVIDGYVDYNSGTLELAGSTANTVTGIGEQYIGFTTIAFDNADATAEGNTTGLAGPEVITGFTAGDSIILDDFVAVSGTYVAGTGLILTDANSNTETLDITGNFAPNAFTVVGNSTNGTTMVEDVPCYLRGTRILTARGQVPVEHLQEGDLVATFTGQDAPLKPIKWIGHTNFDAARHPNPAQVWPVRIRKNAFGDGAPLRDLLVSPGHSVLIDGVLIQAERLINGATIFQDRSITQGSYFHVELPAHDIILSEGLLAESYLDTGNRHSFKNAAPFIDMHPDFSPKHWSETCRELVMSGDRLIAARAHLLNRAHALGYATKDPGIHLLSAEGESVRPSVIAGRRYTFRLPREGHFRLASRSWVPAEHVPESRDTRQLGVCVSRILIGEELCEFALDSHAMPNEGWHRLEGSGDNLWRWTNGLACLPWAAETITIDMTSGRAYWKDDASLQENEKVKASA